MKRWLFSVSVMICIAAIVVLAFMVTAEHDIKEPITQPVDMDPSLNSSHESLTSSEILEPIPTPFSDGIFHDKIPLTQEEQVWLKEACEEFEVPYALALGLIEKETNFQNVVGDDGASTGYMQVQEVWHWDRMERLGVTDLLDPEGNFRVGLDFLSELHERYEDWSIALTVYNMGHNPGFISDYANSVMGNYAYWQNVLENSD